MPTVVLALIAATQSAAQASTGPALTVTQSTANGYCEAGLSLWYNGTTTWYADGWLRNTSQYSCTAWLESSTDQGTTWYDSSSTFTLPAYSGSTWHEFAAAYDNAPLITRTCFKFPWAGAAIHCTSAA